MEPVGRLVALLVCTRVCVVSCVCVCLCSLLLSGAVWVMLFEGRTSSLLLGEVELAELMKRFHVNTAKCSSLIYHESLCSRVLPLKSTLIALLS